MPSALLPYFAWKRPLVRLTPRESSLRPPCRTATPRYPVAEAADKCRKMPLGETMAGVPAPALASLAALPPASPASSYASITEPQSLSAMEDTPRALSPTVRLPSCPPCQLIALAYSTAASTGSSNVPRISGTPRFPLPLYACHRFFTCLTPVYPDAAVLDSTSLKPLTLVGRPVATSDSSTASGVCPTWIRTPALGST